MGRTSSVSNPMRNENPTDANITAYDSLGRVTSVTAPDGSVTSSTWLGATMTSTDPAGVSKILNYDAFNRLLQVTENPGGSPFSTNYLYDALDDLTGVCQGNSFDSNGYCQSGGIGRRFIYDSLKRLTSATNPESGNIAYSYDDNGNVLTKTDARGWITCYGTYSGSTCSNGYDPLNRLTAKTYFNAAAPTNTTPAPAITWLWDTVSKGHLSSVSAASTSPSYFSSSQFQSYDPLGRVTQSTQTTNGNNYTFYYAYNLAGALESETYPSARAAKTCYDSAGRALSVAGTPSSGQTTTYASNVTYAPHGAIQQISRGDNLTEIRSYNNRLQETAISLDTSGNARSAFGQDMYYCSNGAAACTTNNGNLLSLNLPYLSAQQSFSYDAINRLTAAAETSPGTGWSQSYGYDPLGNRWVSGGITTSPFTPIAATNFDTNNRLQIQGTQYDASGNLSAIGGYVYQNDSEGRIANVTINGSSTLYGYDGDNHRILKQTPAGTTVYVYDASGELTAEYSTAPVTNPCQTCYLTVDHLGSTRVMTNPAGSVVSQHDYLPFGEEVPLGYGGRTALPGFQAASTDDVNQKFTGKERDQESQLDYFGARYYGSVLGRFTSPDGPFNDQEAGDPQSWNLYSYVRNNPLANIDPLGLDCVSTSQSGNTVTVTVTRGGTANGCNGTFVDGTVSGDSIAFRNGAVTWSDNTAAGGGAISVVPDSSPETGGDINPFGAGVVRSVGARTDASYKLLAATATASGFCAVFVEACAEIGADVIAESGKSAKADYREKTRGAQQREQKNLRAIANEFKIDKHEFGEYVEAVKDAIGRGKSSEFGYNELKQLARDYKAEGGK